MADSSTGTSVSNDNSNGYLTADGFIGPSATAASFPNGTSTTGTASTTGNMTVGGNIAITGYVDQSSVAGLTAAGSNVATGLVLSHQLNTFGTVTTGKGAVLPAITTAGVGATVTIINQGAGTLSVYGSASDSIDGTAAATGVLLSNAKAATYTANVAAKWVSNLLGATSA